MIINTNAEQRKILRKKIRQQRRALSPQNQSCASKKLQYQLLKIINKNQHRFKNKLIRIGTYKAGDGEISTAYFEKKTSSRRIEFLFPIIQKNKTLYFGKKIRNKFPRSNMYKIPEPLKEQQTHVNDLDILLLPLVAATRKGTRLGMGGGFYDRTLARIKKPGPLLIGIAHDLQIISDIPEEPWDKPINYIATDKQIIICRS
ncbi:MAG TPA: 5-formyltetrahydrofolate cyclo-ligase [Gammaproteobacteria bacterium]|nr:5-formyltetrahydrofolate cyclo-ligase [Gammaproteobacteria bacterium]HBF08577.1 5-formyltetrahydrofolate cyclo-ligase [Gammaproteobacteria bacterium]HCK94610.1 5-formyltetrahydrofolate cyclo-ligase [Gammaproteobacteria bacterium]|tara:strand:- start:125 stop:730 length:606 start_codon:yes stop_codon:yes gene_type:complete